MSRSVYIAARRDRSNVSVHCVRLAATWLALAFTSACSGAMGEVDADADGLPDFRCVANEDCASGRCSRGVCAEHSDGERLPRPSSHMQLPDAFEPPANTNCDVLARKLQKALNVAGYSELFWPTLDNDLVVATAPERIDDQCAPVPKDRFNTGLPTVPLGRTSDFLRALFNGRTGRYRMFVIVYADDAPPESDTKYDRLPGVVGRFHTHITRPVCTDRAFMHASAVVLVYEFLKTEHDAEGTVVPSTCPAESQIRLSGIWSSLQAEFGGQN